MIEKDYISFFIYYLFIKSADQHAILRIRPSVESESDFMGTEFINARFPGSLAYPAILVVQCVDNIIKNKHNRE